MLLAKFKTKSINSLSFDQSVIMFIMNIYNSNKTTPSNRQEKMFVLGFLEGKSLTSKKKVVDTIGRV